MDILFYLLLIGLLIYMIWWRPKVCKEKIRDKIRKMGGEVLDIELIGSREQIYNVRYRIKEKDEKAVVIFNFICEEEWK
ncbi:hypothetical protein RBU49_01515 [Clostridium sp. MB40-C1]|uniref:hypothetical protein n=1 Tax=Clostridium sp. MB40-C1 TaxID=3070996 RepID=UPI0027E0E192|nr:hypothetical protein [Clostridium sp. MB40-C1]WMJ80956.1 hypothetical protein RBU49_01515 [Clostridium sp. MB40-C1]